MNVEADRLAGEQLFVDKPQEADYTSSGAELYNGEIKISRGLKRTIEEMWSRHGSSGYDQYVV